MRFVWILVTVRVIIELRKRPDSKRDDRAEMYMQLPLVLGGAYSLEPIRNSVKSACNYLFISAHTKRLIKSPVNS